MTNFHVRLSDAEFERRKPVWSAFSGFWLDTELEDLDLQHIAKTAAASGYSLEQLRSIYLYEVAPLVYMNLFSGAGEWAYFPDEWLHPAVRKQAEQAGRWQRLWIDAGPGRWLMTWATERHWRRIVALLAERERLNSPA